MPKNGWTEHKKLLLEAHKENKERFKSIDSQLLKLTITVEKALEREKVRATLFGAMGGGIISVISMVIAYSLR